MNEVTFPAFFTEMGMTLVYCDEKCRDQEPVKTGRAGVVAAADIAEEYVCDICGCDLSILAGERLAEASRTDFMAEFDHTVERGNGEAFAAATDKISHMGLRQLATAVERMTPNQRLQFAEHFSGMAAHMARIGAYLDSRYGGGYGDQGHEKAVEEQNRVGRAVRKAQGYGNTLDITF